MMSLVRMSAHLRNRARGLIEDVASAILLASSWRPSWLHAVSLQYGSFAVLPAEFDWVTVDFATEVRRLSEVFGYRSFSFFLK
jgi:hypothetical protein